MMLCTYFAGRANTTICEFVCDTVEELMNDASTTTKKEQEILVILHSAFRLVLLVLSEMVEALKYLCFSQMDGRRCNEWM